MTSREFVMEDATAHIVLKNWLKICKGHDPVDNLNNADILIGILQAEHDRVVIGTLSNGKKVKTRFPSKPVNSPAWIHSKRDTAG